MGKMTKWQIFDDELLPSKGNLQGYGLVFFVLGAENFFLQEGEMAEWHRKSMLGGNV